MELILHLENFNNSLSFYKSYLKWKYLISYVIQISKKTNEENKPLTMENNEFVWNSVKYLYRIKTRT